MWIHCKYRYQLKNKEWLPYKYDPKVTRNGCKFNQFVILTRYCIFGNRYQIFRSNKNVWRYLKVFLLSHIQDELDVLPRWAFCPTLPSMIHPDRYLGKVKTFHGTISWSLMAVMLKFTCHWKSCRVNQIKSHEGIPKHLVFIETLSH